MFGNPVHLPLGSEKTIEGYNTMLQLRNQAFLEKILWFCRCFSVENHFLLFLFSFIIKTNGG